MKHLLCIHLVWLILLSTQAMATGPVLRVVKSTGAAQPLLRNGDFEQQSKEQLIAWQAYQGGYQTASGEGHNGSQAARCENRGSNLASGLSQTLALNRAAAAPLWVRGWSKAAQVSGSADTGYSLYVDLVYGDGTPSWGHTVSFRCGTHDWEQRELTILPEKPVKSATVYALFRGHSGRVWFDDLTLEEIKAEGNALLFQGVPMRIEASENREPVLAVVPLSLATQDGMALALADNAITSLKINETEMVPRNGISAAQGRMLGGFLVRDVAQNSDVYAFKDNQCPALGLKLQSHFVAQASAIEVTGRISDLTGKDRAVTLLFALPVDATGWRWGDDIRRSRIIEGRGEYANLVSVQCGATGTMSLYPLGAIYNEQVGLALAIDMAQPAQFRLVYHAGTKQFFLAYDFGLTPDTERFPSMAEFRFVIYQFDPHWGFRAAFEKLWRLFPEYFKVRSKQQGIWMPFTDISKVKGWEDFGFRYHEGNNNVLFDDAHDILSFRYTEPMTWWMSMKKTDPRTPAEALRVRDEIAQGQRESQRRMALVSQSAAMFDERGEPCLLFRDEPWCQGAVWSLDPNPFLPGAFNAATIHWNTNTIKQLYGPDARGNLDGEYLDSLEGYVTANLNFRREHLRHSSVPLTFATETKQLALFKGLAVFEFTKWFCDQVHQLGKLTFANSVPFRFTYLCPWLDVMGTETDWVRAGKYAPASDAQMSLWRTMSGQKPYLLLMNTDYDSFPYDMVEKYFQRSLFYGVFPSMFSHNAAENPYWQNPKWYDRDRPLFKRYLPLITRIAEAGWQPVTRAASDNSHIYVERFGPDAAGTTYITLLNDTTVEQSGEVTLAAPVFSGQPGRVQELISAQPVSISANVIPVKLAPQSAWLLAIEK